MTLAIYKITKSFPTDERYGITSQLRRAASSIGAQIAEGSRMPTKPHRAIYYERAYASAAEVDNFLQLAFDLGHIKTAEYSSLLSHINRLSYVLRKLILSLAKNPLTLPTIPSLPTLPPS